MLVSQEVWYASLTHAHDRYTETLSLRQIHRHTYAEANAHIHTHTHTNTDKCTFSFSHSSPLITQNQIPSLFHFLIQLFSNLPFIFPISNYFPISSSPGMKCSMPYPPCQVSLPSDTPLSWDLRLRLSVGFPFAFWIGFPSKEAA